MAVFAKAVSCLVAALGGLVMSSAQDISKADVEMSLISELVGIVGKDGQGELEAALQPHFESAPKDAQGALQPQAARYALHRFFVQKRSWFVKGLAESSDGWVPAYLLELLEPRLAGKGIGIRELAALAAVLEGLVRNEAEARIAKAYETLTLPTDGKLEERDAVAVVRAYLADYVRSGTSQDLPEQAQELLRRVGGSLSDLAAEGGLDLTTMKRVGVAMGEQYGHFHNRQCSAGAGPQCLEASNLYAICCREDLAQAEDDGLVVSTPAVVLCILAILAASLRRMLTAAGSDGANDAEGEDDLKKPAPAASQRRPAWAGVALSLLIAVAFALQLLDVTVLAGALMGGLLLLTGVRVAPKEKKSAKGKES